MCKFIYTTYSCNHAAFNTTPSGTYLCASALATGSNQGYSIAPPQCFPLTESARNESLVYLSTTQSTPCPPCATLLEHAPYTVQRLDHDQLVLSLARCLEAHDMLVRISTCQTHLDDTIASFKDTPFWTNVCEKLATSYPDAATQLKNMTKLDTAASIPQRLVREMENTIKLVAGLVRCVETNMVADEFYVVSALAIGRIRVVEEKMGVLARLELAAVMLHAEVASLDAEETGRRVETLMSAVSEWTWEL